MRYAVLYAPSPSSLNPYLSPSPAAAAASSSHCRGMLLSVFLALLIPCAGMSALFVVYIFLLWFASNPPLTQPTSSTGDSLKPAAKIGLSSSELEKLPKVTGKELVMGNECAVCLDEIEAEDPARMIPVCNHGYHLECADKWLSKHPFCPVCRRKIDLTQFLNLEGDQDDSPC